MTNIERVLVIINPASGQDDPEALRQTLEEKLEEKGVAYEIRTTGTAPRITSSG